MTLRKQGRMMQREIRHMAGILGLRPHDMCELACRGGGASISSLCTAFAESEVI